MFLKMNWMKLEKFIRQAKDHLTTGSSEIRIIWWDRKSRCCRKFGQSHWIQSDEPWYRLFKRRNSLWNHNECHAICWPCDYCSGTGDYHHWIVDCNYYSHIVSKQKNWPSVKIALSRPDPNLIRTCPKSRNLKKLRLNPIPMLSWLSFKFNIWAWFHGPFDPDNLDPEMADPNSSHEVSKTWSLPLLLDL